MLITLISSPDTDWWWVFCFFSSFSYIFFSFDLKNIISAYFVRCVLCVRRVDYCLFCKGFGIRMIWVSCVCMTHTSDSREQMSLNGKEMNITVIFGIGGDGTSISTTLRYSYGPQICVLPLFNIAAIIIFIDVYAAARNKSAIVMAFVRLSRHFLCIFIFLLSLIDSHTCLMVLSFSMLFALRCTYIFIIDFVYDILSLIYLPFQQSLNS